MKKNIKLLVESIFNGDNSFDDNFSMSDLIIDYVDLGLPSGTKWCKYNVGAKNETDYGDYYQWSETKDNVIEYTEKYNEADGLTLLLPEDDIAYQTSNGSYRIPTKEQCEELINNTDNEWVVNFKGSGVNGYIFRSKENSNYIFIPAASNQIFGEINDKNMKGAIWSSCRNTLNSYRAWVMKFYNSNIYGSNYGERNYGNSVRGVLNEK